MDINTLYTVDAHEEGAEIRIVSPLDGKETNFYISVQGIDSRAYRTAVKAYHRKLLNEEEGGEIDLLIAITKGWRGLSDNKKEVKFSASVARAVYENAPDVAVQVDRFVSKRTNFIKG
jgi:hypothetical protein